MSSIQEFIDDYTKFQAEFQAKAQEKIKEIFTAFWEKNPAIKAVIWTQYAPYFNDGDPCVFSVHDPYFTNAEGKDLEDVSRWGEYEGEKEGIWSEYHFGGMYGADAPEGVDEQSTKELSNFLCSSVLAAAMEATFGSDSSVIATRAGFDIEGIDHD